MKVVYSADHLRHDPQQEVSTSITHAPFEHVGRGEKIREVLAVDPQFSLVAPTQWGSEPIDAVHDAGLNAFLHSAWQRYQDEVSAAREVVPDVFFRPALRRGMSSATEPASIAGALGWWCFETTTPITEGTYVAARSAVDVALTAAQHVLNGDTHAYGLCRPPGHHATSSLYGGYCFFNNAAIVAHHVASTRGVKVAVLDVDYHHGNGTQEIFYDRDDVLYVSLHGDPVRAYPNFLGYPDETGTGRGLGNNLNIPLDIGVDDAAYASALQVALQKISDFGAQFLVVSLGLDTFITDPICDLALTTHGFGEQGSLVGQLGIPTVVLQEGGYDVDHLGANVQSWLTGLAGQPRNA
jgi:acetoin utilization deacetylase AcuC-like enzyme